MHLTKFGKPIKLWRKQDILIEVDHQTHFYYNLIRLSYR